jgi:hypothetical protein
MTWYKEVGHENYKKGLGFSPRAPSFPRSRRVAVGSERPAGGVLCFLGLLLPQELPNAFVTFLDARLLPHIQGAPFGFPDSVYVQRFAASARTRADHAGSLDL